jgi:hypothetical protein
VAFKLGPEGKYGDCWLILEGTTGAHLHLVQS